MSGAPWEEFLAQVEAVRTRLTAERREVAGELERRLAELDRELEELAVAESVAKRLGHGDAAAAAPAAAPVAAPVAAAAPASAPPARKAAKVRTGAKAAAGPARPSAVPALTLVGETPHASPPGPADGAAVGPQEETLGSRLDALLGQAPHRGWSVAEAATAVYGADADGVKSRRETVRTSLKRKVDRGSAFRDDAGLYWASTGEAAR